jgi:hypothetical protein
MTTISDISREYEFGARIGALLAPYLKDYDRGTALHGFLAVRLAHILIYDHLIARGLHFTSWHQRRYRELCEDRDHALAMLGIDVPPDFVAVGTVH